MSKSGIVCRIHPQDANTQPLPRWRHGMKPLAASPAITEATMKTHLGHYEIESEIGRGGMGVVYRAFEPALNRHVANL